MELLPLSAHGSIFIPLQEKLFPYLQDGALVGGDDFCRSGEVAVFLLALRIDVCQNVLRRGLKDFTVHLKIEHIHQGQGLFLEYSTSFHIGQGRKT
jgi:hypothetical protein